MINNYLSRERSTLLLIALLKIVRFCVRPRTMASCNGVRLGSDRSAEHHAQFWYTIRPNASRMDALGRSGLRSPRVLTIETRTIWSILPWREHPNGPSRTRLRPTALLRFRFRRSRVQSPHIDAFVRIILGNENTTRFKNRLTFSERSNAIDLLSSILLAQRDRKLKCVSVNCLGTTGYSPEQTKRIRYTIQATHCRMLNGTATRMITEPASPLNPSVFDFRFFFTHIAHARATIRTKIIVFVTFAVLLKLLSSHLHLSRSGRTLIRLPYSNAEVGRIDLCTQRV